MTDTEIMEFLNVIPCKYSKDAEAADKLLEQEDIQKLSELCHLMQNVNSISDDFDIAGQAIAEIYGKHDTYAVPALIRKIMYFLVYQAYSLQDIKKERRIGILRKSAYQKMIMESVNKGFESLGKTKKWTPKLWNGDKWGMNPLKDYCDNIFDSLLNNPTSTSVYTAPDVIMGYAGKKNGEYGFMLKSLVEQVPDYKVFIDGFGGSGAATMNIEPLQGCRYVINDYDKVNVNYYRVLATRHTEFIEEMQKLQHCIKKYENVTYVPDEEECDDFDKKVWLAYKVGENKSIVKAIQKGQLKQTYQEGKNVGVVAKNGVKFKGVKGANLNDYDFLDADVIEDIDPNVIPWGDIDVYDLVKYVNSKYTTAEGKEITFDILAKNFEFKRYLLEYLLDKDNQKKYSTKMKVGDLVNTLNRIYNHSAQEGSVDSSGKKIGNSVIIKYTKGLWYMYDEMLDSYRNSKKQVDVEVAVGFFFRHCFMEGGIKEEVSGVISGRLDRFLKMNFNELENYHNRIKYCELLQQEGQYLVKDRGLNVDNAVFYADPPYSATEGYEVYFGEKEMKALISSFEEVRGNFIYSCVAGVGSSDTRGYVSKDGFKYDDLEIDFTYNVSEKHLKQRKEIAKMFSWFIDICREKPLYVLFGRYQNSTAKEMLETSVSYNIKLELMITDIDFDVELINQNSEYEIVFCKMDFVTFYDIVSPILLG